MKVGVGVRLRVRFGSVEFGMRRLEACPKLPILFKKVAFGLGMGLGLGTI